MSDADDADARAMLGLIADELPELRKQRDELVEALEANTKLSAGLIDAIESSHMARGHEAMGEYRAMADRIIARARSLLAKVRG